MPMGIIAKDYLRGKMAKADKRFGATFALGPRPLEASISPTPRLN